MATLESYDTEADWLAARTTGIGASEAAAVLGLSPWKSPLELWAEKAGLVEAPTEEREAIRWGKLIQPLLVKEYARETGRATIEHPAYALYRDATRPWLLATPDALTWRAEPDRLEVPGVVEVKNVTAYKADAWVSEPPLLYQVQVQQQLAVLGYDWGSLAALIGGNTFRWVDVAANADFQEVLILKLEAFWLSVQRESPPPADGSDRTREILAKLYPKPEPGVEVALPPESAAWGQRLTEIEAVLKATGSEKSTLENQLRAAIGAAEIGVAPDGTRWSHKLIERAAEMVPRPATSFRQLRRLKARA